VLPEHSRVTRTSNNRKPDDGYLEIVFSLDASTDVWSGVEAASGESVEHGYKFRISITPVLKEGESIGRLALM
jgi:hypothetical protein